MTQPRTKVIPLSGKKFELRRLPPEVGSYIFIRMLGARMRMQQATAEAAPTKPVDTTAPPAPPPSGEDLVKALSFVVFSSAASFDEFKFMQSSCMKVTSLIENREGMDFPMPLMSDDGQWTRGVGETVSLDVGLLTTLASEVLVLCFADFFEDRVPGS